MLLSHEFQKEDLLKSIRKRNAAAHAAALQSTTHHSGSDSVTTTTATPSVTATPTNAISNHHLRPKPSMVSFSNTRTTVTINEEPSLTTTGKIFDLIGENEIFRFLNEEFSWFIKSNLNSNNI